MADNSLDISRFLSFLGAHPDDFQRRKFDKLNPNAGLDQYLSPTNSQFLQNPQIRARLDAMIAGGLGKEEMAGRAAATDATKQITGDRRATTTALGIPVEGHTAITGRMGAETERSRLPILQQEANTNTEQTKVIGQHYKDQSTLAALETLQNQGNFMKDPLSFFTHLIKAGAQGGNVADLLRNLSGGMDADKAAKQKTLESLLNPAGTNPTNGRSETLQAPTPGNPYDSPQLRAAFDRYMQRTNPSKTPDYSRFAAMGGGGAVPMTIRPPATPQSSGDVAGAAKGQQQLLTDMIRQYSTPGTNPADFAKRQQLAGQMKPQVEDFMTFYQTMQQLGLNPDEQMSALLKQLAELGFKKGGQ